MIKPSELILNPDGSVYHLNLKPEHISDNIIFVGDQYRVERITQHFDSIEFSTQKREFKTQTGWYNDMRLTVISTGIGPDNIDIVMNELDALVNIDLNTRLPKKDLTSLNIIRIGTSGALQPEIKVDSFLASSHALDLNGMMHFYNLYNINCKDIEDAFIKHSHWDNDKAKPIIFKGSEFLLSKFITDNSVHKGITATAGGFYGPQGRVLRLELKDDSMNSKLSSFNFNEHTITNLEMETAAIYGLSQLLGHNALSLNAIIANRANGTFSNDPKEVVNKLITYTLNKFSEI